MINNDIKQKILENAVSLERFHINDITYQKEDAKKLIKLLIKDDIGILGGSVYKIDSMRLIPLYDNWACNPNEQETAQEYYMRSKETAFNYIDKYPVDFDENILFSIVFTVDVDWL
jgi:hypothetical protein